MSTMCRLIAVIILVIPLVWGTSCAVGIPTKATATDTLLQKIYKENGKLKRVLKGNRRTGTVYYYLNSNGKIYSIQSRRQYGAGKVKDSSGAYFYYFINDSLVMATFVRNIYSAGKHITGFTKLYFEGNRVTDSFQHGDAPTPNISLILREAYAHRDHSYTMDIKHRYRKSTHLNFD